MSNENLFRASLKNTNNEFIKFYDYAKFKNIRLIGSGTFGKVYYAVTESSGLDVVLKSFDNNNAAIVQEIIDELKLYKNISTHNNIIRFYGIATEEGVNDLKSFLVFEYADSGTLSAYLQINFYRLNLTHKLNLVQQLVDAIKFMHEKDIVHGNLNSDNILVHKNIIKISDVGLSGRFYKTSNMTNNLLKNLPYMDPKCLQSKYPYEISKKSDIYSLGILIWMISSGRPPFEAVDQISELVFNILSGVRESPIEGTPLAYITLYTDCWQDDPEKRPNIQEVSSLINYKILQQSGLFTNVKSYEFFKKIVEELCEMIIEEKMKGKTATMILDRMVQFFVEKRQRPENIIDWCLNNQINPIVQCILATCYYYGKWVTRDVQKVFEFSQKSVKGGFIESYNWLD
ncbi:20420_t:CDS:2 [Cetraspora pellucida]|uniref:20420_t:CDS:1 n=1 Tax=Cetraspora pellucida TaxID=1433469 RepID=A0A9N9I849_9GLOM|nr:20420_t:CDS:2 [Cetraspora pellucida]